MSSLLDTKINIIRQLIKLIELGIEDDLINHYIEHYRDDYILFTEYEYQNAPEDVKELLKRKRLDS